MAAFHRNVLDLFFLKKRQQQQIAKHSGILKCAHTPNRCPITCGKIGRSFVQHDDMTSCRMRTSRDLSNSIIFSSKDPELRWAIVHVLGSTQVEVVGTKALREVLSQLTKHPSMLEMRAQMANSFLDYFEYYYYSISQTLSVFIGRHNNQM